jgi:flagellar basal-body rod modification protein FlgD
MTSPITAVGATSTGTPTSTTGATATGDRSQLSADAFLKLFVAQLQYQDPSKPTDTATMMQETATLNQIQTMQQLSAASKTQQAALDVQTATAMVGRTVRYTTDSGTSATGHVTAATLDGTSPTLTVDGTSVPLSSIKQVMSASPAGGAGAS